MSFTPLFYYCFILPVSRLPFMALYRISDLLFFLLYYLVPYRKKVVLSNLRNSFPDKSETEIRKIARSYYQHLCDLIVESFKSFAISNEEVLRRMTLKNPEVIDRYFEEGRNVIIAGGHYNNWEWFGVAVDQQIKHQALGIYKPLSDRFMDEKMRETRGKYGLKMIPMKEVPAFFSAPPERPTAIIFGVDQSPGNPAKAHWMKFLHQETAVPFGAEKYAKEQDLPVVYCVIRKLRRGYYAFECTEITNQPRELPHGAIMEKITQAIEKSIQSAPEYWLWSHRRWKHRRPEDARSISL